MTVPTKCRRCGGPGLRIVHGLPPSEFVGDLPVDPRGSVLSEFRRQCGRCGFRWGVIPPGTTEYLAPFAAKFNLDLDTLVSALDDRFTPRRPVSAILCGVGPTRPPADGMQLLLGSPAMIVLTEVEEAGEIPHHWIEVAEYRVGPGAEPMRWGAVRTLALHQEPYDLQLRGALLASAIKGAARRRAATFRKCSTCQLKQAPEEFAHGGRECRGCDSKPPKPPSEPIMTRAERLAAQRDSFVAWAETATTDEVPGRLPGEPPRDRPQGGARRGQ